MKQCPKISVAIPTFGREAVLIETIQSLLNQVIIPAEILVIDQTPEHEEITYGKLLNWHNENKIVWLRLEEPSIINAMNEGLSRATFDVVLFLDDDIVPDPSLVATHALSYLSDDIWAVTGQVLQPGEKQIDVEQIRKKGLYADLSFKFNSSSQAWVRNCMAGNLSVRRYKALEVGGFDENFQGVSYRFETDFARRIWQQGGKILFQPRASIQHLRASSGGTRSRGNHLTSASPRHGQGDYYFALKQGLSFSTIYYILKRPFREIRTRFHLRHPWWIPVKLIGEIRALWQAVVLYFRGPKYIDASKARPHDN